MGEGFRWKHRSERFEDDMELALKMVDGLWKQENARKLILL